MTRRDEIIKIFGIEKQVQEFDSSSDKLVPVERQLILAILSDLMGGIRLFDDRYALALDTVQKYLKIIQEISTKCPSYTELMQKLAQLMRISNDYTK
jgi:hypothetical protein